VSEFFVNIEPKNDGSGLFRVTVNKAAADKLGGVGARCSVRRLMPTGKPLYAFVKDPEGEELRENGTPDEYIWEGPPRP
jgi:hypothetical protein